MLDLFAIMLPGSLATWLVVQYIPTPALLSALFFGLEPPNRDRFVLITAFLFSSFMLGHFVFMPGAHGAKDSRVQSVRHYARAQLSSALRQPRRRCGNDHYDLICRDTCRR